MVAAPYALLAVAVVVGWLPAACVAAVAASLPGAAGLLAFASKHRANPETIRPLKKFAIKWHTPFGLALAAGLTFARRAAPLV